MLSKKPIQLFGGHIAPDLVNQILNDTGTDPDHLPLMQHALMRTWFATQEKVGSENDDIELKRVDYENVGRFNEALSRHLDEAWEQLDNNQQKIAKQLFLCLCEHAGEGTFIRRMVKLGEVAEMANVKPDEVIDVVRVFQDNERNFIMASPLGELNKKSVLDISHEALLRQWNRLTTWIENEASSAQIYKRLVDTAILHKEKKAQLLVDPELQIALNWKASVVPNKVWAGQYNEHFDLALNFLDESNNARDHERAEVEIQHRWRIPRFFIFIFVFVLFFGSKSDSGLITLAILDQIADIAYDLGLSDEFSYALSEVFLVSAHVVLYLGLEYFLKGLFRRFSIEPIRRKVSSDSLIDPDTNADEIAYSGFWRRLIAGVIDVFVLYTTLIAVMAAFFMFEDSISDSLFDLIETFIVATLLLTMWLYEAIMTSRWRQATFGKMVVGIYVTDIKGERLTFLRASARFIGKFLLYGVGLLLQPFTEKKQALYDKIASTLVVRK
ncbi:RDD family protein [Candidatus Colwellia aromaticivorans]|uniref:RDD family protein n=1 Tax=Candidatus Colwellia aromaticivorans TaxID=2267621 RepID=UPI000DF4944A|nr:RDD family protein [Candidatus Colwellia aromaticivorans]